MNIVSVPVFPVVPVSPASGHPSAESVTETGSGAAAPLVRWTGIWFSVFNLALQQSCSTGIYLQLVATL